MGKLKQILPLLCLLAPFATAEEESVGADLQFVSDVSAIQPGVPFTIALHIHHHQGFHTYWKAPGIVGVPTSIAWKLPAGFQAGPIQWPAPKVVDMATHPAHGYHRDVLLLVEVIPPREITAPSVNFVGDLTWMACSRTCNPGFAQRRLSLPVNRTPEPKPDSKWARMIARERADLPGPCGSWSLTVESRIDQSPVRIRLRPLKGAGQPGDIYFFSEDGQITSEPAQTARLMEDGSYLIEGTRSEWGPEKQNTLPGTLVASGSWLTGKQLRAFRAEPRYSK